MSSLQDALAKMVQEGALRVAPGGPDVVLCTTCGHSVVFHMDGCPEEEWIAKVHPLNVVWPLAQAVAFACYCRGVVLDLDLLRADIRGTFSFAPIVVRPIMPFRVIWEQEMDFFTECETYEAARDEEANQTCLFGEVYVYCPEHGWTKACKDVENGYCSKCSDEFHRDLVETSEQEKHYDEELAEDREDWMYSTVDPYGESDTLDEEDGITERACW